MECGQAVADDGKQAKCDSQSSERAFGRLGKSTEITENQTSTAKMIMYGYKYDVKKGVISTRKCGNDLWCSRMSDHQNDPHTAYAQSGEMKTNSTQ